MAAPLFRRLCNLVVSQLLRYVDWSPDYDSTLSGKKNNRRVLLRNARDVPPPTHTAVTFPLQYDLDIQFLCEFLVPIADRNLGNTGNLCHLSLGSALIALNRCDVDRSSRNSGGSAPTG